MASKSWGMILDPLLLTIMIFPFFYFLMYKPLKHKIVEQKKIEASLRKSLKEIADYKYALNEATLVVITSQDGIIQQVNDNFCKISKYSREELIGQDHRILNSGYHPKEFFSDLWETIEGGAKWSGEVKNKAKDGTFHWLNTTIIPFLNDQGSPFQYLTIREDITERKTAEENILQSESRLKTAQRIANIGSWEMDFTTAEVTCSDEMYHIFECDPSIFTLNENSYKELIHPDDRKGLKNQVAVLLSGKNVPPVDIRLNTPDGRVKWIQGQGEAIFNEKGKIVKVQGTAQDMTESKKTLFELSKLKEAVDASADAVFIIDREKMKFVDCNETALEHLGYSKEELLKMGPSDIKQLMTSDELAEIFDGVISSENKTSKIETPHLRKDGTQYDAEVYLRSFLFDGSAFLTASVRDVTERNKTEQELEIIAEHLKEAQAVGHLGSWEVCLATNRSIWSEESYKILGLDPNTTVPSVEMFLSCIHPDDVAFVQGKVNESLVGYEGGTFEYRIKRKDGTVAHISAQAYANFDTEGKLLRVFGIMRDVTEIKVAEKKLKEYEHFFNHSNDLNSFVNTEGYLEVVNPRFKSALGYSEEELFGTPLFDFLHPDDVPAAIQEVEKLKSGAITTSFINRFRKKDGDYLWLDMHITPNPVTGRRYAIAHDITERKKAEEEIYNASRNLTLAVRAGGVGIWVLDIVNNHLKWDDRMYFLYGITPETFSGAYESWEKCVHPEDIERGNAEIQAALLGEIEFDTEFRVIWPDSSVHYLRAIANIERDADGNPLRIIGTNWDITKAKQTEETLRNTVKEVSDYRLALDESSIIAITDKKGIIKHANDNFCKISKYSREELIGQDHRILNSGHHPKEFIRNLWVTIANGKVWKGEMKNVAKDGTFYWVDTTIVPFLDKKGKSFQYVAIRSDITERKKTEQSLLEYKNQLEQKVIDRTNELFNAFESLKEKEYRLSEAQRIAKLGNWEADMATGKVLWSDEMYRIFDCDPATFTPNRKSFIGLLHPEDRKHMGKWMAATATGNEQKALDFRVVAADGSIKYVRGDSEIIFNKEGKLLKVYGTAQDLTERNLLEQKLRQSQKMEAVGTLAGGIAHDFNNLLGTIVGYSSFLTRKLPEESKELGYVKQISLAAERASELVKQILTFSRVGDYELKPVEITALIKESVQLLRSTLPATIEIHERTNSNCRPVLANPTQIQQVLINLCTNALHSMEKSGGILDITAEEIIFNDGIPHLKLNKGTYLKLTVSDTGMGMAPEIMERIFEPFYTTKEVGKGTGLGLSMVHGIMEAHKGAITVESEPNSGTVFQLFFPIVDGGIIQEEPEEPTSMDVGEDAGSARRILIVEDELSLANFYETFLKDIGCRTTMARNGYEALEVFREEPDQFDLVFTDQTMPKMTGSQLSQELLKIRSDISIVLATGYSSTISEKEAKNMGISYFLMKPVEPQTLDKIIKEIFSNQNHKEI